MDPLLFLVVVLLVIWLGGITLSPLGPIVHVLLVIALVVIVIRVIQGRSV